MEATTTLADALLDDLDDLSDHEYVGDEEKYIDARHDDDDDGGGGDDDPKNNENNNNDTKVMTEDHPVNDSSNRRNSKNRMYENKLEHPDFIHHIQTIQQYISADFAATTSTFPTTTAAAGEEENTFNNSHRKNDDAPISNTQSSFLSDSTTTTIPTTMMRSHDSQPHSRVCQVDHSQLLTRTNQYLMMMEQELEVYHSKVVDIYQYKFPQLDTIITNRQQYIQVVQILDNHTDITMKSIQDSLNRYLTNQQIITISIAYSTCNGRSLTTEEVQRLHQHVQYIIQQLLHYQSICLQYIEQQMIYTVPNMVSFLNSSSLAAQLLSHVPHGSMEQLTKIPACNLQLIGSHTTSGRSSSGGGSSAQHYRTTTTTMPTMSASTTLLPPPPTTTTTTTTASTPKSIMMNQPLPQHAGILIQCDLVQSVPKALQMKVLKIVASKLALVIRCDYNHSLSHSHRNISTSTSTTSTRSSSSSSLDPSPVGVLNHQSHEGHMFRQQVQTKIQQLLEPEKAPTLKALPKPDLTVKKRRGGQRMRRLKGRYEETTLMKQANTRAFSMQTGEYGDDAMGRTLGLLEMSTGSVGASATTEHSTIRSKNSIEQKKMKYANTRASRKKATQMSRQGLAIASSSFDNHNTNQSSGMASSMVFTPVQGMELVNPDAMKDRVKEANRKWFSSNAGFQSAVPPKK